VMSGYPSHCSDLRGTARPGFLLRPVNLCHCQSRCGSQSVSCSSGALSPGVKAAESWSLPYITIWECRDEEYLAFTFTLSIHLHAWGLDIATTSLLPFLLSIRVLCYGMGTPAYQQISQGKSPVCRTLFVIIFCIIVFAFLRKCS
jgi:hypothetical protein